MPESAPPPIFRVVTRAQVSQAVLQLRERRGATPDEQLRAVLHALNLTVHPDPAHHRQHG